METKVFRRGVLWVMFTVLGLGVMTISLGNYMSLRFETTAIQEQEQLKLGQKLVREGFSTDQSAALANTFYEIRDIGIANRYSLAHFQFAFSIGCFLLSAFIYKRT